jgi:hypothetical protein
VASTPYEVALRPFFGVYGPYRAASDPWRLAGNRAFLEEFYRKTSAWLADPKTYRWAVFCAIAV